jgi:hypothetical protein
MTTTSSLLSLVQSKRKDIASKTGKGKTVKPPAGDSKWRILPTWRKDGSAQFWHDFGQHFIKNTDGKIVAVYLCTDKTYERPCEVCEKLSGALMSTNDNAILKALGEAKPGQRILVNALRIDGPANEAGTVHILELSPTTFQKYLDYMTNDEYGEGIIDPNTGRNITIKRDGTGKDTEYNVMMAANPSKVDPSVLAKLNDLDAFVAQESDQAKRKALQAVDFVQGKLAMPMGAAALTGGKPVTPGAGGWGTGTAALPAPDEEEIPLGTDPAGTVLEGTAVHVPATAVAPAPAAPAMTAVAQPVAQQDAQDLSEAEIEKLMAELA